YVTLSRPPATPLFPYTTLFRSNAIESRLRKREKLNGTGLQKRTLHLSEEEQHYLLQGLVKDARTKVYKKKQPIYEAGDTPLFMRSEEHTSELQSRENLVCRLLL